jgi:quinol monooxygenase YgiN
MLHVIATIEVAPGKRADFLAEFNRVVPLVRAEDGCIEYGAAVDVPTPIAVQSPVRPDVAVVVEKWANLEKLQAHLKAPHMAEYRQRVMGLVRGVTLQILEPAE